MAENPPLRPELQKLDIQDLSCGRLFDEVPCYISIQDRNLRVVEANRKITADFGDCISKYCFSAYKGRTTPCVECPVVRTFGDAREHTSQEMIFDRHGLPHDVIVNTKPLLSRDGKVGAVMELFTDITVQKELEHRLHDSLNRFHHLFDVVPCFITVQDQDFRILEANHRFKESFGDQLGQYCFEIYKRRQVRCPECPVAQTFADGEVHHGEEVVIDNAGNQVHVVIYAAPVKDRQGNVTSVMEMSTDITEMRTLQDKLASLGQLVGGTAHSVKNILEGLRGGVYIVNIGFRDNNQEEIRTGWAMVVRNVERLSAMILDMLYCAKDRPPGRHRVSLRSVADEVTMLYTPRARDLGVELASDVSEDADEVLGEHKDIHSLISNLVSNAIDACCSDQDEGKRPHVALRIYKDSGRAVIQVKDNGAGMDEEARNKLFAMMYSTKGTHGTGLGLLVSHKVATEHGGTISVESALGQGSTFTVRLPLAPARMKSAQCRGKSPL